MKVLVRSQQELRKDLWTRVIVSCIYSKPIPFNFYSSARVPVTPVFSSTDLPDSTLNSPQSKVVKNFGLWTQELTTQFIKVLTDLKKMKPIRTPLGATFIVTM